MPEGNNMEKPLSAFIERVENLLDEKSEVGKQIKEVLEEAKASGFDKKLINEMIRLRKMDTEARREREDLRDTYINALDLI